MKHGCEVFHMLTDSLCQFPGKLCRQVIIASQCCKPFI